MNTCERNIRQTGCYQTDCEERIRSQFIMKSSLQFILEQTICSLLHVSDNNTKKVHAAEYIIFEKSTQIF